MANPGGKGSTPRPLSVSQEQYNERWDAIFSKDLSICKKRAEKEEELIGLRKAAEQALEAYEKHHVWEDFTVNAFTALREALK